MRAHRAAPLFLLPYAVLFVTFILLPVGYGFWISLHEWHVLSRDVPFVGFQNYRIALQDDLFVHSIWRTLYFILIAVPIGNVVSLLLAVGLVQNYRGLNLYKTAFYLPVITSVAVVTIVWRWLYAPRVGILNYYLGNDYPWLSSPDWAMPSIAFMSIWWGAGGNMLVYLAALKAVPKELNEAASLDGASPWRRWFAVSLPSIRPVLLFCLVMSVIGASQIFAQTLILTNGGPADSTLTVMLYMYRQGFGMYQLGYACAVAYLLFAGVLAFSLLMFRVMRDAFFARA